MKIQNKLLLTLCLLASASQPVNAIIIGATTYVNTKDKTQPPLTILQGKHYDMRDRKTTNQQRDQILKAAIALRAAVAAEDLWYFDGKNEQVHKYLQDPHIKNGVDYPGIQIKIKGISGTHQMCVGADAFTGLLILCKKAGVPIYNLECRHYKDASTLSYKITGQEVWQSFVDTAHELLDYTDDIAFLEYPSLWVDLLDGNKDIINSVCNLHSPIGLQLDSKFSFFGSELIDMHMLHALTTLKEYPHIIMCTGDCHAINVEPILFKYGYKAIHRVIHQIDKDNADKNIIAIAPLNIPEYFATLETILKNPDADASGKEKKS